MSSEGTKKRNRVRYRVHNESGSADIRMYRPVSGIYIANTKFLLDEMQPKELNRDEFFLITYCIKGVINWAFVNERLNKTLKEEDIYLESSYLKRLRTSFPEGEFESISIFFKRKQFFEEFVPRLSGLAGYTGSWFDALKAIDHSVVSNNMVIRDEILNCYRYRDNPFVFQIHFLSLVNAIVEDVISGHIPAVVPCGVVYKAYEVKEFLRKHVDTTWRRKDLMEKFNLNDRFFRSDFHRLEGMNLTDYVRHLRVEEAKRKLRHTDLPIASIAASLDYSNPSKFAIVFREITGFLPSTYREMSSAELARMHLLPVNAGLPTDAPSTVSTWPADVTES
ncbi:MAG: AraC family transcriptional regulator [Eubacteriales bacterium]|nr:AraC family transcriptional regulator [Eubacteriales bacterium]